jgi:hypothetical protein
MAAQIYRWRWRNEGLFRTYKRMLAKVKLRSRTVATVHREGEASMLALQLLLAVAATEVPSQNQHRGRGQLPAADSPRRLLLRMRGDLIELLRRLGPRQFADYQRSLEQVRSQACNRTQPKVRRPWPHKREFKAPKPPKILVMPDNLKAKMAKRLRAA